MRVLIVTHYFYPERSRINDLAVGLSERGHEVTVYSPIPSYPEGRFYPGYGFFQGRRGKFHGMRVLRFPVIPRGSGSRVRLFIEYASAALMSSLLAPAYCRDTYDVTFVFEASPVSVGLPAVVLKRLRSIPIVFWILDLWPDTLEAVGGIRSPFILRPVERFVRFLYDHCDRILISSNGFRAGVEKAGYRGPIDYFPNWVEAEYLAAPNSRDPLPELPEGFRIMFAGNIGESQDFETILCAAEWLRDRDIHWLVLGDGRAASWVRQEIARRQLAGRVHLLGRFPGSMMAPFFQQADVLLATLRRAPAFALTAPGKLQSYLASGKPIIAAMDGEGGQMIEDAGAGFAVPASSPAKLVDCVETLYRMSADERGKLGASGRAYCEEHFDRGRLLSRLEGVLQEAVGG